MRRIFLLISLTIATCSIVQAQRFTDNLNRGLVAVPTGSTTNSTSNVVTWRRLANEYYDVTYNVYKDGACVAQNLSNTCYNDGSRAYPTTKYQVAAVVRGVEQQKCDAVTPWTQYVYKLGDNRTPTGYIDITLADVYDRNGTNVTANYLPNDAEMADLDGDGDLEIIVKRQNTVDSSISDKYGEMYSKSSTQFDVFDAYDVNWQTGKATLMWRIDCGPNMVSMNSTELDLAAYDWDEDGKAEVVMRGADNMIVYGSDGKTRLYTIGNMSVNTRDKMNSHTDPQYAWTHTGAEYLIYINGATGALYQKMDYPLKRLESNESSEKSAWGDDYGHRSSKYFIGAPFLDGLHASLFLARGIYTRHKMIALDLNKASHTWTTRWTWNCNSSKSAWYGQGNHNYAIADVDEDGRDEIVFGSMVIDDNGHGLSTTGLGHGDALHVSDFDPYRKGLEAFACNETSPNNNYRNATTSAIYYRSVGSSDDGRAMMGNFSSTMPGCLGTTVNTGIISSVTDKVVFDSPSDNGNALFYSHLNFRIYWDGDLGSEILDSPGEGREAAIWDYERGRLFTSSGCNMNNGSKNNPCFQGDIIGDWREEIVVRCGSNLRVYTTGISTDFSLPCLWYDHQYRQAMVWQMMAYNQPPHLSYFIGELEGMTVAPPSLTNSGRTIKANGSTIGTTNEHLLVCGYQDMSISVQDGAAPYILTVNTPTWVQGNDDNANISTTTYTHTLTGGAFSGTMRLIKQGDGKLVLPTVTETYTGQTDVWGGTLQFDGTLKSSRLWLNRFTTLLSDGGNFLGGITADYGARIIPGGEGTTGSITTNSLTLNHGARLVLDVNDDMTNDKVNATTLTINTKTDNNWTNYGPQYLKPVIEVVATYTLPDGTYDLGQVGSLCGSTNDIVLEGAPNAVLKYADSHLWLIVGTGISKICPAASISEVALQQTDEGILLPVVNILPAKANGTTASVSGIFTDLDGNKSEINFMKPLFVQDFEGSTNPQDYWKNNNEGSSIFTTNYANSTGQCIGIMSSKDRGDYTPINADYTGITAYNMEFDAYFNNAIKTTDFVVMSKSHFSTWTFNYGYMWENSTTYSHNPYLFYMQRMEGAPNFKVNESENATLTLDNSTWYHFTLSVNVTEGSVNYAITKKGDTEAVASGTYKLRAGESAECDGIYIRNGRFMYEPGGAGIDNITIYPTDNFSYAFTRPGTLTVTSRIKGYSPTDNDFKADFVGVEMGNDGYTTLGCNYALDLTSAGLDAAYIVNGQNTESVSVEKVSTVPAATGLLLKGAKGIYRLPIAPTASATGTNLLKAVTSTKGYTVASDNIYTLDNKANGIGFYICNRGTSIPAGKAYLPITSGSRNFYAFHLVGDVNNDGTVDVSDYIGVANHILGNTPDEFNKSAADVNNNGKIDISDYIGVANIILTGKP